MIERYLKVSFDEIEDFIDKNDFILNSYKVDEDTYFIRETWYLGQFVRTSGKVQERNKILYKTGESYMNAIISVLGVTSNDITSSCRKQELVDARVICAYYMRKVGIPPVITATLFCKNHSTILHYYKVFEGYIYDPEFKNRADKVENYLKQIDNGKYRKKMDKGTRQGAFKRNKKKSGKS